MGSPVISPRYLDCAAAAIEATGRSVSVINDSAGFVAQRIVAQIVSIGSDIAQQGIAAPEDVDLAVRLGLGYPMGPLELGDQVGRANIIKVLDGLFAFLRRPLLPRERLVEAPRHVECLIANELILRSACDLARRAPVMSFEDGETICLNNNKLVLNRRQFGMATLAGLVAAPTVLRAQGAFPNRPLKLIVPYAPGGATDTIARLVAQRMSENIGQQIIVENRSGAGGVLGTREGVRAEPDGYSILFGNVSTLVLNSLLYTKLNYNAATELKPLALIADVPNILVVNPDLGHQGSAGVDCDDQGWSREV